MAKIEAMFADENIMEADDESSENESETSEQQGSGWANVMTKILGKQNVPKPILAKAKKDKDIKVKQSVKNKVEVVKEEGGKRTRVELADSEGSDKEDESDDSERGYNEKEKRFKKALWNEMARAKPDAVADRDKEKRLQRVATKGVVQLFNAVKKQQNMVEEKFKEVGSSDNKRTKVMKSLNKGDFLDMLKGTKSNVSTENTTEGKDTKSSKIETKEDKPAWNVLREDFMMGAKMKDWDKENSSSDEGGNQRSDSG